MGRSRRRRTRSSEVPSRLVRLHNSRQPVGQEIPKRYVRTAGAILAHFRFLHNISVRTYRHPVDAAITSGAGESEIHVALEVPQRWRSVCKLGLGLGLSPSSSCSPRVRRRQRADHDRNGLGTMKDRTGGVVPGATVVLINEARGTKTVPAVTSATGDYVFPNVTADTYTVEVTMDGFQTVRRTGVAVSGGDRVAVGDARRSRWAARPRRSTSRPKRRSSRRQSGERSFTIATSSVENLPISGPQLRQPHAVDARRHRHHHAARRRRAEQHHDGRRLDDGHRQQRADAADERRGDCRGQGADVRLPGRVRPVERAADHGRHQERHQPVPRLALRRRAQLGLEREQLGEREERRRRRRSRRNGTWATRSAGRSASPAATTSCSSSTATNTVPARAAAQVNRFRVPTAAERAGDFSASTDQNGAPDSQPVRLHDRRGAFPAR